MVFFTRQLNVNIGAAKITLIDNFIMDARLIAHYFGNFVHKYYLGCTEAGLIILHSEPQTP